MNLREKERFDYAVYNDSGRNIPKPFSDEHTAEMADETVKREKRLVEDIIHSLQIYAIDDCITVDELDEGAAQISALAKDFRAVHVDLREVFEHTYDEKYPDYQKSLNTMTNFIKNSRRKKTVIAGFERSHTS